jgi:hypothetical protein
MTEMGKLLMLGGAFLMVAGVLVWGIGRSGFRGLPGDIQFQGPHVRIYFPIVTCIVLSLLLTAIMWVLQWWRGK